MEPEPAAPVPVVGAVRGIKVVAQDGAIDLSWVAPPATAASVPVVDYRARCRAGDGPWIEDDGGVSVETKASIEGLTNGTAYQCEVTAVGAGTAPKWTAAAAPVAPMGRPSAPGKPTVEALDGAVQVAVAPDTSPGVSTYRYECSADGGATWSSAVEASPGEPTARLERLTNGAHYICRA